MRSIILPTPYQGFFDPSGAIYVVETAGSLKETSLWHLQRMTRQKVEKMDKKLNPNLNHISARRQATLILKEHSRLNVGLGCRLVSVLFAGSTGKCLKN